MYHSWLWFGDSLAAEPVGNKKPTAPASGGFFEKSLLVVLFASSPTASSAGFDPRGKSTVHRAEIARNRLFANLDGEKSHRRHE